MIETISAQAAYEAIQQGAVLLDVREKSETSFCWVTLKEVIYMPYSRMEELLPTLPQDKMLIVCCAAGIVSEQAAVRIAAMGHDVKVLHNGLIAWKLAHLPMTTAPEAHTCCSGGHHHE